MIKYEFHIAKNIRDKFKLNAELFSLRGGIIFSDINAVRKLTHQLNSVREESKKITVGELNALGLLDEIIHYVIRQYDEKINPRAILMAVENLKSNLSEEKFKNLLVDFNSNFPPLNVYLGRQTVEEYLSNYMDNKSNIEISTEEMILLYLANFNPASKKVQDLFDEDYLSEKDNYKKAILTLQKFFENERRLGTELFDLLTFLKMPFIKYPHDLLKQLDYIESNWKFILGNKFTARILGVKDIFKEEAKLFGFTPGVHAPTVVPQYRKAKDSEESTKETAKEYLQDERFTPDVNWMPNVVLIAKNAFVWLDQLSKKYKREIKHLDQIPNEELDLLASRNINALWLIGIWERSPASKKIKHLTGNIDAVASAYSLYDYTIAEELGGEKAFRNLDNRAKARGIRLASDMVPNHTGIYSDWVINHPDYFIQRGNSPYPSYTFNGPNLSDNTDVEIKIEDGYYSKTDAAVVFRWRNTKTNETRFIYHGNDGTNMPWNDTAQLDMIKAEVREAVIQKIFDVAERFSIIRFDAAMTLAKRHFRRLWYPEPGSGGDIPSRSEFAMAKEEFEKLFPKEFWREVVDRINHEKPDTLLLAEAFWLMEGYFVRTLGMHRVYNSAFMHMMMNEENEKYRDLITNTLEFDPEILKRYVNFMSNPDEETAIKQFGTGDKYFGVCLLLATLPGLPMFAHGQIEGFTEKYGMEYKRAYYDEQPNQWLIERHQREIFPLLAKRYLFSEVKNFWLYDFVDDYGAINENVFAFTNKFGHEKVLVVYNNKYDRAYGHIKQSTPKLIKENGNELKTVNIWDELEILPGSDYFYIARELTTNKEFIFHGEDICCDGFVFWLDGFQYYVFYGFREVYDSTGSYRRLFDQLQGRGTDSIEKALLLLDLEPVHYSFLKIFNKETFGKYVKASYEENDKSFKYRTWVMENAREFFGGVNSFLNNNFISDDILKRFEKRIDSASELNLRLKNLPKHLNDIALSNVEHSIKISLKNNYKENLNILLIEFVLKALKDLIGDNAVDDLLLDEKIDDVLKTSGLGEGSICFEKTLLKIMNEVKFNFNELAKYEFVNLQNGKFKRAKAKSIFKAFYELLNIPLVQELISLHVYRSVEYYSKENFEDLVDWLFTISLLEDICELNDLSARAKKQNRFIALLRAKHLVIKDLKQLSVNSGYKWTKFRTSLKMKFDQRVK